jgi:hypothetical protein
MWLLLGCRLLLPASPSCLVPHAAAHLWLVAAPCRRQQLQAELAAAEAADSAAAAARVHHELLRTAAQRQQAEAELRQQLELSFGDLLTVVRPAGERLLVDKPGHKLVSPG